MLLRLLLLSFIVCTSAQLVLSPIESCTEIQTTLSWLEHYLAYHLSPLFIDYRKQLHQQYVQWCRERYSEF
jgi:hypothetical protein